MNLISTQYNSLYEQIRKSRLEYAQQILKSKIIQHKNKRMRFQYFIHGQKPLDGYRLIFGLHGGGNCPSHINQQQFTNHLHLYDNSLPTGSIWFIFRSAQQASDMWWKQYIPQFITLIIQCFSIINIINHNKVFITGYSAGGDGIYHLAGMMADQIAGAMMMAGHPNHADLSNLRNLVFSIQLGEDDHAYDRSNLGKKYIKKLNQLGQQYGGFKHYSKIHPKTGHWMNKHDCHIFPYFFNQSRQPYPQFIIFNQHPRTFKPTFYYIKVYQKHPGTIYVHHSSSNKFQIQSTSQQLFPIIIMLNRYFIDENKQIEVYHNGELTVKRMFEINKQIVRNSIEEKMDPWFIFQDQIISVPNKVNNKKIIKPYSIEKKKQLKKEENKQENNKNQPDHNMNMNMKINQNMHIQSNRNKKHSISKQIHKVKKQLQQCTIY